MKYLRIIISLILVGAAGLMMSQDLRKSEYLELDVSLGSFKANELNAWYRERDWEAWIERQLEQKELNYQQRGKSYLLEGKGELEKDLEATVSKWNQNEDQRSELEEKQLNLKAEKVKENIQEFKEQEAALAKMIMRLASIQLDQVEVPSFDFEAKKSIPKIKTSSLKAVQAKKAELKKPNPKLLSEPNEELEPLVASIESMKQVIQTQLVDLEQDLTSMQAQEVERDAKLFNELRSARIEENKVANQSLKLLYTELRTFQSELNKDLNKMVSFVAEVDQHQTALWYHEKNMLMERLGLKRSTLSRKIKSLLAQPLPKSLQPIYAIVKSKPLQLTQAQVAESFRFLLAGLLICLLFNLIWEVISQRKTF